MWNPFGCNKHHFDDGEVQHIEIERTEGVVEDDIRVYRVIEKECQHDGCSVSATDRQWVGTVPPETLLGGYVSLAEDRDTEKIRSASTEDEQLVDQLVNGHHGHITRAHEQANVLRRRLGVDP
jgi:hypothetical protein